MESTRKSLKRRNSLQSDNSISLSNPSSPPQTHVRSPPLLEKDLLDAAQTLNDLRKNNQNQNSQFISRVSEIPIVNAALSFYDHGKQSSRLVKYGAETLESSVKSVCNPFVKRMNVSQLDNFACRQLDKLDFITASNKDSLPSLNTSTTTNNDNLHNSDLKNDSDFNYNIDLSSADSKNPTSWKNLLGNAKSRAAALQKDALDRLKYCLEWLRYAIAVLESNISSIRSLISDLQASIRSILVSENSNKSSIQPKLDLLYKSSIEKISETRIQVIKIVRSVIETISKYASAVLPADARKQVKSLILSLPSRCAPINNPSSSTYNTPNHSNAQSFSELSSPLIRSSSSLASPLPLPNKDSNSSNSKPTNNFAKIEDNAQNLLSFANESYIMLDRVHSVFGNIYANAQIWVYKPQNSPEVSSFSPDLPLSGNQTLPENSNLYSQNTSTFNNPSSFSPKLNKPSFEHLHSNNNKPQADLPSVVKDLISNAASIGSSFNLNSHFNRSNSQNEKFSPLSINIPSSANTFSNTSHSLPPKKTKN
ncbi:hypothetical protein AYI70_g1654 [Smittium culicis]|uniref:Clock-controlled protein 8 n=1 Tax=Smittium culicis TaxID=133412 RepID=A0A1R1YBR7_9FUNG|nr:hypothetical protein AYI70_g1654 [Smittium culicis]